jgi:tetratricopeptide (TPR) repeat protein
MRFFLTNYSVKKSLLFLTVLFIFCWSCLVSFAQSKKFITKLYGSYLKGLLHAEKGDYQQGLRELEKARKLDPDSFLIRLRIATVLIRLGEFDRAEKELKRAKKLDPDNLDAYLALIFLYSYAQKDEALEKEYEDFLETAQRVKPQDQRISEHLAQFYFFKNRPYDAIKIYEVLFHNNPQDIEVIFWLGFLYEEVGTRDKAIELWEKGLTLDPAFGPILNSLGYIYAEEETNLEKAESLVKKALETDPENGAYLDSLGWVYFKKKEYKEAEKHLKQAVSLAKDPVIYDHLGDLYVEMNNIEDAVKVFREGLNYFPDDQTLQKKLEKYERRKNN